MEILSLWRSPLDKVALTEADALGDRQPRCSCTIEYYTDFSAMTVYNFGAYIHGASGEAGTALTNMFHDMNNPTIEYYGVGGVAFVPQQSFMVDADSFAVPDQCNIVGSGGGGVPGADGGSPFFHFVITPGGSGASTFLECNPSGNTSGGIYFQGLAFQWGASTEVGDLCIDAAVWNTRAIRCTFTDCPRAFDAHANDCALEQCTIDYTVSAPIGTTAIILRNPQCAVLGPGQLSQTSQGDGGASGCTCIAINDPAEHAIVADVQIYEWTLGGA